VAIIMQMIAAYMVFYLEGRADEADDPQLAADDTLDIDKIAEKALAGPDELRTIIAAAVRALAAALDHSTDKRDWLKDHKSEIQDAGGNGEEAYRHYCKGVEDEACLQLENDVVEAMEGEEADDEEEDEEEDD
jgi:hypothetical protein